MKSAILFLAVCLILPQTASAAMPKKSLLQKNDAGLTKELLRTKAGQTLMYAAADEVAVAEAGHKLGYRLERIAPTELKMKLADTAARNLQVFYASTVRSDRSRYIATGRIIVRLKPGASAERFASAQHLPLVKPVNAALGIYLFSSPAGSDVVRQSNTLNTLASVQYAAPEWIRPVLLR